MKLCQDCKFFVPNEEWGSEIFKVRYAVCANTSYVAKSFGIECYIERNKTFFGCGKNAKYFEPKNT